MKLMMSDSEEEDYMAAISKFVAEPEKKNTYVDPRRSTPAWRRQEKVRRKGEAAREEQRKRPKMSERKLEEGMEKKIGNDNKGFKLLAKMGFKEGQGLGKSGSGRTEPVGISLRKDRAGLGREEMLSKLREETKVQVRQQQQRKHLQDKEDFRARMRAKFDRQKNVSDVLKSRRAIEQLDEAQDLPRSFLWCPIPKKPLVDDDGIEIQVEEPEELPPFEELEVTMPFMVYV